MSELILAIASPEVGLPVWAQGLLAVLSTVSVAWFSYKGLTLKTRAESDSAAEEREETSLRTLVESLGSRLTELESKVSGLEAENLELERENRRLWADNQTKADVIQGFTQWLADMEVWRRDGFPDPPGAPPHHWAVRKYLKEVAEPMDPSVGG